MNEKTGNLLFREEFKNSKLIDAELPRYICKRGKTKCQKANSHYWKQY